MAKDKTTIAIVYGLLFYMVFSKDHFMINKSITSQNLSIIIKAISINYPFNVSIA